MAASVPVNATADPGMCNVANNLLSYHTQHNITLHVVMNFDIILLQLMCK